MSLETRSSDRSPEVQRDKPQVDRVEHANLDRPGAQAHPLAHSWHRAGNTPSVWRRH